jgi:hypothetical protein
MTDQACRIYETLLNEHGGDANAALMALANRYAAMAGGVSRGFLRRPLRAPDHAAAANGAPGAAARREPPDGGRYTPPGFQNAQ